MKKALYLWRVLLTPLAVLLLVAFTSCEREHMDGLIEVTAESFEGGKVRMDGAAGTWVDGDIIRVNGETVAVERHEGQAFIRCSAGGSRSSCVR